MPHRDLSRLSMHRLNVFRRVVDLAGVKAAAEDLMISQPVVSEHLRAVETVVGGKLLFWEGRTLHLTPAGEAIYELARSISVKKQEINRRLDSILEESARQLIIGGTSTLVIYYFPAVVLALRKLRPQLRVTVETFSSEMMLRAVVDGSCDIGMTFEDTELHSAVVEYEELFREPIILVTARQNLPKDLPLTPQQLKSEVPFVCAPDSQVRRTNLDRMLRSRDVASRHVELEFGQVEAVKAVVKEGFGFAFLMRCTVGPELASGALVEVPVDIEPMAHGGGLWYTRSHPLTHVQQDAIDLLRRIVPQPPAGGQRGAVAGRKP